MNISSRDSAVPVFLLRNCAGHLSGSLRTIGAVAVGQLGKIFYGYLGRRACGWHHLCSLEFWGGRKEMATHASVLAWRIPGTGEPGGLPSMGSHRVGHD